MSSIETTNVYSSAGRQVSTFASQPDTPASKHPDYIEFMEISELARTLMVGTRGMIKAGTTFLTKFTKEKDHDYERRLKNSILKNAFRKTVQFLSGQVFQSAIQFTDEFPEQLLAYMDDVDLLGSTLAGFSKRTFETSISLGVTHILVDAPDSEPARTMADEVAQGRRPWFKEIRPENVIGWQQDDKGNLLQIRIAEIYREPQGQYAEKQTPAIRILTPGAWQLFIAGKNNAYTLKDEGTTSLEYIPLITCITGQPLSILTAESPLQDLADLNLHHWRSFSDQTNILNYGRVPLVFGKMLGLASLEMGSTRGIIADEENADLKFVEPTGAAIAAGANDLKECEAAMALYGLQQLIPRTGNMTATEKALSAAESNSSLGMWVNSFEDSLIRALQIFGDYLNVDVPPESVKLPVDFSKGLVDPAILKILLDYVSQGILSKQTAFEAINRLGVLGDGLTFDVIRDEIAAEKRDQGPDNLAGIFGVLNQPA